MAHLTLNLTGNVRLCHFRIRLILSTQLRVDVYHPWISQGCSCPITVSSFGLDNSSCRQLLMYFRKKSRSLDGHWTYLNPRCSPRVWSPFPEVIETCTYLEFTRIRLTLDSNRINSLSDQDQGCSVNPTAIRISPASDHAFAVVLTYVGLSVRNSRCRELYLICVFQTITFEAFPSNHSRCAT